MTRGPRFDLKLFVKSPVELSAEDIPQGRIDTVSGLSLDTFDLGDSMSALADEQNAFAGLARFSTDPLAGLEVEGVLPPEESYNVDFVQMSYRPKQRHSIAAAAATGGGVVSGDVVSGIINVINVLRAFLGIGPEESTPSYIEAAVWSNFFTASELRELSSMASGDVSRIFLKMREMLQVRGGKSSMLRQGTL